MKASELKDRTVVSMADGTRIGRVSDVLFDTADLRLAALALSTNGGQSILPFAAIRSLGADAVTVESATATQGAAVPTAGNVLRGLSDLTGMKAVNADGTLVGTVRELEIDQAGGQLLSLELHRGGVLGLGGTTITAPVAAVRSIGPELVTLDLPAEPAEPHTA
jgi:sporulation protein YlmC with PRC-barrel domain